MSEQAGFNGVFPSVSPAHFSFFEPPAELTPSYFLFPDVRMSDQNISLTIIRTNSKEQAARQRNVRQGQMTPFGRRQFSYSHMINRFRQTRTELKDVRHDRLEAEKKQAIKGVVRRIQALTAKVGQPLTLEENEELRALRGILSPRLNPSEDRTKEQFKAVWKQIQANNINGELTTIEQ